MTGLFEGASGLNCYQCDSSRDPHCPEYLRANYHSRPASLTPTSCHGVFEARYCVKTTGMFEGELGTKRFCSARDWGNYCEWVRRPGDEREYRACVFTCWGDSCNAAHHALVPTLMVTLLPPLLFMLYTTWLTAL
ncbi:UPAR/Ly6 domain-containing protein bou [Cherax quadricarinatus]|uniref:UPAR/Ly6 domain-containing protein bou n=1 Tax=Cherax quadricarinatus TaxID=27406 RepID=UPI00387E75AB